MGDFRYIVTNFFSQIWGDIFSLPFPLLGMSYGEFFGGLLAVVVVFSLIGKLFNFTLAHGVISIYHERRKARSLSKTGHN